VEIEDGPAAVTGDRIHVEPLGTFLGRCEERMIRKSEDLPENWIMAFPWTRKPLSIRGIQGIPGSMSIGSGFFLLWIQSSSRWKMEGKFYVVGVGPGDPQLMTLKAAGILEKCYYLVCALGL
jgi:hypothetical protein